ncbi:hypothetical protein BOX15_Mlig032302g1, partial [Macrostomum lignano]
NRQQAAVICRVHSVAPASNGATRRLILADTDGKLLTCYVRDRALLTRLLGNDSYSSGYSWWRCYLSEFAPQLYGMDRAEPLYFQAPSTPAGQSSNSSFCPSSSSRFFLTPSIGVGGASSYSSLCLRTPVCDDEFAQLPDGAFETLSESRFLALPASALLASPPASQSPASSWPCSTPRIQLSGSVAKAANAAPNSAVIHSGLDLFANNVDETIEQEAEASRDSNVTIVTDNLSGNCRSGRRFMPVPATP